MVLIELPLSFSRQLLKKVVNDEKSHYVKDIFERIGSNYNLSLIEWHYDKDHVHILFKAHLIPNCQNSSMRINPQAHD